MNFLSSISNAVLSASSAALAATSPIPGVQGYLLGSRVTPYEGKSIWTLYEGTKKDDQTPVSIFAFDLSSSSFSSHSPGTDRRSLLPLARNAFRKLRATRHPNVLKFLDGSESETAVWIITEHVKPLLHYNLSSTTTNSPSSKESEEWLSEESKLYGLLHLVTALTFLNRDGQTVHGGLRLESVWVTKGGEWKLGGFEVCSRIDEQDAAMWNFGGLVPNSRYYASPEVRKGGWTSLKEYDASVYDSYLLHLFLYQLFNGPSLPDSFYASSSTDQPPSLPQQRGSIPQPLFQPFRRLGNPNPLARLKTFQFLELGNSLSSASNEGGGWWTRNRLVGLSNQLENFTLASENERTTLIRTLKAISSVSNNNNAVTPTTPRTRLTNGEGGGEALPSGFLLYKVLPSLLHTFEFGGPASPQLLPLILSLSQSLPSSEYSSRVLNPVLRMFATPDRAMRMALLEGLEVFGDKLSQKDVVEKVWPHLLSGFGDVVPVIREATVKSILLIAPKLNDRILNNDLLRYLSKTQTDVEPGIRTNTCILLSRLTKHLSLSTQRKVLIPAFARALRDPFVHARIAGLMALMATVESFEKEDLAGKVIPAMSICLVDKEKAVRDQGYKAIDMFVKKCEALTASMPDTAIPLDSNPSSPALHSQSAQSQVAQHGLATNAAGAAGALAGWAFGSVSKKLSVQDLSTPIERRSSTPTVQTPNIGAGGTPEQNGGPAGGGGGQTVPGGFSFEAQTENGSKEDWGGDLIDVHDDTQDWDEFESGQPPPPTTNRIDPLAARLSSSKAKPSPLGNGAGGKKGSMRLGAASKSSALRVPMDMDATDSWDLDFSEEQASPAASARGVKPKPAPPSIPRVAVPSARSTSIVASHRSTNSLSNAVPPTPPSNSPRIPTPTIVSQPPSPLPPLATPPSAPIPPTMSTLPSPIPRPSVPSPAPPTPRLASPPPPTPVPSTTIESRPHTPIVSVSTPPPPTPSSPALSASSATAATPAVPLTKEEKAAKLAAAREERKRRMAAAKGGPR